MVDAKYEPGRDALGHFTPGNSIGRHTVSATHKRLMELRALWYDANSLDDMKEVKDRLLDLIREAKQEDVKLKAIIYYLDRQLGRPTERVEMDVQGTEQVQQINNFNLPPEQLAIAADLVRQLTAARASSPVVVDQVPKALDGK